MLRSRARSSSAREVHARERLHERLVVAPRVAEVDQPAESSAAGRKSRCTILPARLEEPRALGERFLHHRRRQLVQQHGRSDEVEALRGIVGARTVHLSKAHVDAPACSASRAASRRHGAERSMASISALRERLVERPRALAEAAAHVQHPRRRGAGLKYRAW